MEELVSARIFSHWQVVQAQFFWGCVCIFFSHSYCMGFFFYCKGFAGIFFLKSSTPPLKDQMANPLEEPIKHLKRVGQPQCYGKDRIV